MIWILWHWFDVCKLWSTNAYWYRELSLMFMSPLTFVQGFWTSWGSSKWESNSWKILQRLQFIIFCGRSARGVDKAFSRSTIAANFGGTRVLHFFLQSCNSWCRGTGQPIYLSLWGFHCAMCSTVETGELPTFQVSTDVHLISWSITVIELSNMNLINLWAKKD